SSIPSSSRSASAAMRSWSAARTCLPARTAATAPGSDRPRWILTWSGRSSPRWPKARASPRGNSGGETEWGATALLQIDAVAHLAETRIGRDPGARARDRDHMQIGAASEAQPLHDIDVIAGACVLADSHHLVTRLAADPQRFR